MSEKHSIYSVENLDGKIYVCRRGEIHLPCRDRAEADLIIEQIEKGESAMPAGDDSNFYIISAINENKKVKKNR